MIYRIAFRDIHEVPCYIFIHDEAFDLSWRSATTGVTDLTPASYPFETQEEEIDSIFTPIVYQTGYIRVVDCGQDVLDNIIPQSATSYRVTFLKDVGISWVGFVAPDAFRQDWGTPTASIPAEIEIPVMSPLAALQYIKYPGATIGTNTTTIATIIKNLLDQVYEDSGWGIRLYYPSALDNYGEMVVYVYRTSAGTYYSYYAGGLESYLYNHNFATYNDDDEVWEWDTCYEVLEKIALYFGWQWREWGKWLTLGAYDTEEDVYPEGSELRYINAYVDYDDIGYISEEDYGAGVGSYVEPGPFQRAVIPITDVINYDGTTHSQSIIPGRKDISIKANINLPGDVFSISDFKQKLDIFVRKTWAYPYAVGAEDAGMEYGTVFTRVPYMFRSWKEKSGLIKVYNYYKDNNVWYWCSGEAQEIGDVFSYEMHHETSAYTSAFPRMVAGGSIVSAAHCESTSVPTMKDRIYLSGLQGCYNRQAIKIQSRYAITVGNNAYIKISASCQAFDGNAKQLNVKDVDDIYGRDDNSCKIQAQLKVGNYYLTGAEDSGGNYVYSWTTDTTATFYIMVRNGVFANVTVPTFLPSTYKLADGMYVQLSSGSTAITGEATLTLYTPSVSNCFIVENLKIEVLEAETLGYTNKQIDDEEYEYRDKSDSEDNLYRDDEGISLHLATDRGRANGLAILRKADGKPITISEPFWGQQQDNAQRNEEYLLARYVAWYRRTRKKIQIECEYTGIQTMARLSPVSKIQYDGKLWIPAGHSIDWKTSHDKLTLLELQTLE